MSPAKRALLVASPYGNLEGPENDVEMMARVLQKRGFLLHRCCGREATREGIRAAWQQLISETSTGDVVVIYYSGHGGAALPGEDDGDTSQQWRLQFIVPMDYDESPGAFSGISEVELSQLLLDTTDKTQNVTAIFDCCHSGRMVLDPSSGKESVRKNLPTTHHHDIARHIERLRQMGMVRERMIPNPHAVRIAAAAPWESAYEYSSDMHGKVGAFTEALVRVLEEGG
ncbi:peptidase C14, caspase domain-containing protein [Aspergillus navahoensis]